MKINVCDVCLTENKLTFNSFVSRFKSKISIHLCKEHKDYGKGKTPEDYLDLLTKAEIQCHKLQFPESKLTI